MWDVRRKVSDKHIHPGRDKLLDQWEETELGALHGLVSAQDSGR